MLKFRENEEAVSPVIGVILMVAITVILAAVIAAFVFGMTDSFAPQKEVYVTATQGVTQVGADTAAKTVPLLTVTIQGGKDIGLLEGIEILFDGKEAAAADSAPTDPPSVVKYKTKFGANLKVGDSASVYLIEGTHHVIVRAAFSDGSQSVILEKTITVGNPQSTEE